ncbi:hypothetical protein [Pontiella sulfatireligans]|uniref:Uncharacterized protein n=1 Tax=Pontiella sulfatireligans TaxID=2750658 RepID=A0A6C2UUB1_9BACT|nr:hypothetical protein [Pontiella sulfatireligans]VGO22747.1 hypothetical protein SCARR_04843 [Pontiella sulfatireligans]
MKTLLRFTLALLAMPLLLAGCLTTADDGTEMVIPKTKQNDYLSKTVSPQTYGFEVYPVQGGISYRGTCHLHARHMASANFIKGNIPVIDIRGSAARKKMDALLDVSSPSSWIEFATSQRFDADFMGWNDQVMPYRGVYNTGGVDAYAGRISQLRIKQLMIEDVPFYIRMATGSIGPLARGIEIPKVDAVIGWETLSQFEYIQFDLRNESVQFSSTIPYVPHEQLVMTQAMIVKLPNYGLAVRGAIYGESMPILLDFAGNYNFARGDKRVTSTKQVSIGDIAFRKVPTLMLPVHNSPPRAGRKMLEEYIVTICNKKGVVYFELHPED